MSDGVVDLPVFWPDPPSPEFASLLRNLVGDDHSMRCLCGRLHVSAQAAQVDPAAYVEYVQLGREFPEYVIFREEETIWHGRLLWPGVKSVSYVQGCPCHALAFLEQLVQGNLAMIADYAAWLARVAQEVATRRTGQAAALANAAQQSESRPGAVVVTGTSLNMSGML